MGCIKIAQNQFIKCSQISLDTCKTQCNLDCVYVSCKKNIATENFTNNESEIYSMCLPKALDEDDYTNRCNSFQPIDSFTKIDECDKFVQRIIAETKQIPFILIILAILLLLFIFSLIYYRCKVNNSKIL